MFTRFFFKPFNGDRLRDVCKTYQVPLMVLYMKVHNEFKWKLLIHTSVCEGEHTIV